MCPKKVRSDLTQEPLTVKRPFKRKFSTNYISNLVTGQPIWVFKIFPNPENLHFYTSLYTHLNHNNLKSMWRCYRSSIFNKILNTMFLIFVTTINFCFSSVCHVELRKHIAIFQENYTKYHICELFKKYSILIR